MIANIKAVANCIPIINYNEDKVKEGEAERYYSNIEFDAQNAREDIADDLDSTADMNEKLSTNKFYHIPISFPPGEDPDRNKTQIIIDTYIKEMGLENRPFVAYRHNDTSNVHYHLVIPSVDNFGTKTKEWKNYELNESITRRIEKDFSLKETQYKFEHSVDGKEVTNIRDKRIYYSLSNMSKADLEAFSSHFALEVKDIRNLSNSEIRDKIGADQYKQIYSYLQEGEHLIFTDKEKLRYQLTNIRNASSNQADFERRVEEAGLYIRKQTDKGLSDYRYGIDDGKGGKSYFNGFSLSKNLTYQAISNNKSIQEKANSPKQERGTKHKLSSSIFRSLRASKDLLSFIDNCHKQGIKVIVVGSATKLSGFRFQSLENPAISYKGSEINRKLSSNAIMHRISVNGIEPDKFMEQALDKTKTPSKSLPSKTPSQAPSDAEQQEEQNRRKRKRKEEQKDQERDI